MREHVSLSHPRAVETGRWVVHAAVSGISGVVAPDGEVIARSELFVPAITRAEIRASNARTLYVRMGDWVVWVSVVGVLVLFALPRGRRRSQRAVTPLPATPRTLVVLPTYNERQTISAALDGLPEPGERVGP